MMSSISSILGSLVELILKTFPSGDDTTLPYCVYEKLRTFQQFLGIQKARKDSNLLLRQKPAITSLIFRTLGWM